MTEVSEKLRSQIIRDEGLEASLTKSNAANSLIGYAVLATQSGIGSSFVRKLANVSDLIVSQCRQWVRFASMNRRRFLGAMKNGVSNIGALRIPAQVIKGVVERVAIVVTPLLPVKRHPAIREQNEAVNSLGLEFALNPQIDSRANWLAALHADGLFEDSSRLQLNTGVASFAFPVSGPDFPVLRSLVIREARNRYPHD